MMKRTRNSVLLLALCVAMSACAGDNRRARTGSWDQRGGMGADGPEPGTTRDDRTVATPNPDAPRRAATVGPTLEEALTPARSETKADGKPRAPASGATTPADAEPSLWRADGRPVWWIDRAARGEDGRVAVTAEAFAGDVRAARRQAIEAARAALRRAAPGGHDDETVDSILVRVLPGDAPGRGRFVGYARASAAPRPEPEPPAEGSAAPEAIPDADPGHSVGEAAPTDPGRRV